MDRTPVEVFLAHPRSDGALMPAHVAAHVKTKRAKHSRVRNARSTNLLTYLLNRRLRVIVYRGDGGRRNALIVCLVCFESSVPIDFCVDVEVRLCSLQQQGCHRCCFTGNFKHCQKPTPNVEPVVLVTAWLLLHPSYAMDFCFFSSVQIIAD